MGLRENVQKALADNQDPKVVWDYLAANNKAVKAALADNQSPEEIQKFFGLNIRPVPVSQTAPPPSPTPKPTAFGKIMQKAKESEQQKLSLTPQGIQRPWWMTPRSEPIQNPPATAELRSAPEQSKSIRGFWDKKGNFISLDQYERAIDQRRQIRNLQNAPTGDFRLQAFAQGVLPIAPKEQLPPGLEKAFPVSYYGGKLAGLVASVALSGGVTDAVKASPYANLLSWQVQNSPQALNMIANSAKMAATFGAKELADQASRVFAGEEPTAKNLVGKPLKEATWGAVSGGVLGIENTLPRLAATAGASAAYDSLMKLVGKGKITKDDVTDIVLMAGVRTAIRAIGSQRLTEQYKASGMEDHLNNKLFARAMRGKPTTPEAIDEAYESIAEVRDLPREFAKKLFGKGIQQQGASGIHQNMDDLGRSAYELVVEQKFPGFEGMPTDVQEKIIGTVISEASKGTAIDQAIDYAGTVAKPFTDQALTMLQAAAGGLPTGKEERISVVKKEPLQKLTPKENFAASVSGAVPLGEATKGTLLSGVRKELKKTSYQKDKVIYDLVEKEMEMGEGPQRGQMDITASQEERRYIQGAPSANPEWFKNQGFTKEQVRRVFEKLRANEPITDRQTEQGRILSAIEGRVDEFKHEIEEMGGGGIETIKASDLQVGQTLKILGSPYEVIHKEGDTVYLNSDAEKPKVLNVNDEVIYDQGSLMTKEQKEISEKEKATREIHERYLKEEPITKVQKTNIKLFGRNIKEATLRRMFGKSTIDDLTKGEADQLLRKLKFGSQIEESKQLSKKFELPPNKPKTTQKIEDWLQSKGKVEKPENLPQKPSEMPKASIFTSEGEKPLYPEGTSNKAQRKAAHVLATKAGLPEKEYRALAQKVTGFTSTVHMSEEQAQDFIHAIDDRIRKNEEIILKSPFVSRDRRMKVLDVRMERARQIGKSVTSGEFQRDADNLRKTIKTIEKDPGNLKNIPDEILDPENYREATIFSYWHSPRHEFRRDKEAYDFSRKIADASINMTEIELQIKKETAKAAKELSGDDLIAITRFRDGAPNAPLKLTAKQAKFNDFLQKKFDKLHKLFGVKGYIKGYISRMTPKEILTAEEKLIERFFGEIDAEGNITPNKAKIPGHINEWFKKQRTGRLQDTEENALKIFNRYVHTGLKSLYFKDIIDEAKTVFPRFNQNPKMKKLLEDYLFRILGYPSENESAWTATLKDVHKFITTKPVLKQAFKLPGLKRIAAATIDDDVAQDIARVLIDLAYVRTIGLRPISFLKQMLQTLNNTVPQLGYGWSTVGLNDLLFNHGIKKTAEDKIFHEFAPQLYKELGGQERTNWDNVRDNVMIFHSLGDKMNRTIVYRGATHKFNYHLKDYVKHGDINKFMTKLEVNKLDRRIQENMIGALKSNDVDKAKKIYTKELTELTQYAYTKEESPMVTRSAAGKMVYQLSSWPINYIDLMRTAATNENWKFFARQTLMYAMLYGFASKALNKKQRKLVTDTIGPGPLKRDIAFKATPPAVEPMSRTMWMVLDGFLTATIKEQFEPGSVKKWAKKHKKDLYTLRQYEPLIFKDIERWLK